MSYNLCTVRYSCHAKSVRLQKSWVEHKSVSNWNWSLKKPQCCQKLWSYIFLVIIWKLYNISWKPLVQKLINFEFCCIKRRLMQSFVTHSRHRIKFVHCALLMKTFNQSFIFSVRLPQIINLTTKTSILYRKCIRHECKSPFLNKKKIYKPSKIYSSTMKKRRKRAFISTK